MTFGAANACMAADRGSSWSSSGASKGNKKLSDSERKIDKLTKKIAELETKVAQLEGRDATTLRETSSAASSDTAKKTQSVQKTTFYSSTWDGGYGL